MPEEVVLIPAINGRPVISRADMAARGVPASTVTAGTGTGPGRGIRRRPGRIGRTDYWYEDEWTAWHEAHQRAKIESLTQVDRDGDPDDLVDAAEAARMMGYASRDVIHANRRLRYFPEPDAYGTTARGRAPRCGSDRLCGPRPTAAPASGGGHKPGTPGAPAKPHPYAGDERLDRSWPSSVPATGRRRRGSPRSGASASARPSASSAPRGTSSVVALERRGRWRHLDVGK